MDYETNGLHDAGDSPDLPVLSEDLVAHAFKHLILLQAVDTWPDGGLYMGSNVRNAVQRYTRVFLPIYANASLAERQNLKPPLDVAWVWHVHRLNPTQYEADCRKNFRKRIDPDPLMAFDFTTKTPSEWITHGIISRRPKQHERFYPPEDGVTILVGLPPFKTSYDLEAAVARQSTFLFQILRACYTDPWYLQQAVQRYRKFLALKKKNPDLFVVPMYDIDFIWHTHQSLSGVYARDCHAFLGALLDHNDEVGGDRSPGSQLQQAFQATKDAWAAMFPDEPYQVPGSCHIPCDTPHPATLAMGKALELYDSPGTSSPTWRAGAHALYLQYLVAKGYQDATTHCCVWKKDRGSYAWKYMRRRAREFAKYRHLPHYSTHPCWIALLQRSHLSREHPNIPAGVKAAAGSTVEGVPVTADGTFEDVDGDRRRHGQRDQSSTTAHCSYYGAGYTPPAYSYGCNAGDTADCLITHSVMWMEAFDSMMDLAAGACELQEGQSHPLEHCAVAGGACGAGACGAAVASAACFGASGCGGGDGGGGCGGGAGCGGGGGGCGGGGGGCGGGGGGGCGGGGGGGGS